jgi:hypothetical protein
MIMANTTAAVIVLIGQTAIYIQESKADMPSELERIISYPQVFEWLFSSYIYLQPRQHLESVDGSVLAVCPTQ